MAIQTKEDVVSLENPNILYELAKLYEKNTWEARGDLRKFFSSEAKKWYQQAVATDHPNAKGNFGVFLYNLVEDEQGDKDLLIGALRFFNKQFTLERTTEHTKFKDIYFTAKKRLAVTPLEKATIAQEREEWEATQKKG